MMAYLKFTLTMPNNNAWNGKWSGDGIGYYIVKNFGRSKAANEKVKELAEKGSWYYNFGDGWGARVSCEIVDAKEAAKARKKSQGFCGYDWMVSSIVKDGVIAYEKA